MNTRIKIEFFNGTPGLDLLTHFDSLLVILRDGDDYIFVRNAHRAWEFPGGTREPGESWEQTAKRESLEEAGATIKDLALIAHFILPSGQKTLVAKAWVEKLETPPPGFETTDLLRSTQIPSDVSFGDNVYQDILDFIKAS